MTDEKIIELIQNRKEDKALIKLYRYQGKVTSLVKSRGGSKDDAQDVFQEALLILCKKVWEGNFKLTAKLDTYLYSICYNLWRHQLEKNNKHFKVEVNDQLQLTDVDGIDEAIEKECKINLAESVLIKLGEPCLKLLKMFYYEALKMKEIANRLGYKSESTAKTQKYKCIERAKKQIKL